MHAPVRRLVNVGVAVALLAALTTSSVLAASGRTAPSDPRAVRVAKRVMAALGGREAWDATRHVRWTFFGKRRHFWDKATGDVRIESDDTVILMNVHSRTGRAQRGGVELEGEELAKALEGGYAAWINDSYWMFMPYKLLDPGVRLAYGGLLELPGQRKAHVLTLTFDDVGLTPTNRYDVHVDAETLLPEQWAFYRNASDRHPAFTRPFNEWKRFGRILLATNKGTDDDWNIAVFDSLPHGVYDGFDPVSDELAGGGTRPPA